MTNKRKTIENMSFKDKKALLDKQTLITSELHANRDVSPFSYNPKATRIAVPKAGTRPSYSITLTNSDCHYKRLIFSAMNAAFYSYFMTEDYSESRKSAFHSVQYLWRFLNKLVVTETNRGSLLKNFETWRVKSGGVKTQSTGLRFIKLNIQVALSFDPFSSTLKQWEYDYLRQLAGTRPAPNDDVDAINLNNWLSQHTWLRRDDVGIGHELYTRLSSPKALMTSFRITVETSLLYVQTCKDAFVAFFKATGIIPSELTDITIFNSSKPSIGYQVIKKKAALFYSFSEILANMQGHTEALIAALELLVFCHVKPDFREDTLNSLLQNKPSNCLTSLQSRYNQSLDGGLFDIDFLNALAGCVEQSENLVYTMPVCGAEKLMFSWLMAYQTVQTFDIHKLKLSDFKFLRRANGRITHIECDYWKGRANTVHQIKTLSIKDDMGKAVLQYIKNVTALSNKNISLTDALSLKKLGPATTAGKVLLMCQTKSLTAVLQSKYREHKGTPVFLDAMLALLNQGVTKNNKGAKNGHCETLTSAQFFGLTHIKTSAVYANTDNFDPSNLLNFNSHADLTERQSYLTPHNEDWLNRCGRITRAVMQDLAVNVFRASNNDKQLFNSEFTKAIEAVKHRSDDTLLRMKLLTHKKSGRVDDLGFTTSTQEVKGELPDTLYLEDSPQTVMRMLHYLKQLEKKHSLIFSCAPEFLFATALPTAEWIESLFDKKMFSKQSMKEGQALYRQYFDILPPHFTAQIS